ncbi:MAG TPA: hypothetical protein VJ729_04955 [Nitrososphaeraceae archaeon]|nr:hypothetical protein [Nitrososphaeraceae archaeon]
MTYRQQAKKTIFVFIILTLLSSLSAADFVTANNNNLAFASKKGDTGGGGSGDSGGGDSGDKGGSSRDSSDEKGSSDSSSSSDKGSDNGSSGSGDKGRGKDNGGGDTSSTSTQPAPPATNEQTCPDGSKPDPATGNCPPAMQQNVAPLQTLSPQQTCPQGSTPDANGNCPTTANQQNAVPPAGGGIPNCPDGSALDASGNCPTPTNTPVQPQTKQVEVPANPDGRCPEGAYSVGSSGNAGQPGTGSVICLKNVPVETPTPQTSNPPEFEIKPGIVEPCGQNVQQAQSRPGFSPTQTSPGNEQSPCTTPQKLATLQTLTPQQTCKDGSTPDANGICQDGSTPVETPPATTSPAPKLIGNGVYELPTVPPEPTVTGIPSCPSGSHQIFGGAKCVVNGVNCPSGTVLINEMMCGPQPIATPPKTCPEDETLSPKGNCVSGTVWLNLINGTLIELGNGRYQLKTYQPVPNTNTIAPVCPRFSHLEGSNCVKNGAVCPSGTIRDDNGITCSPPTVLPGTNTGTGGGFIQLGNAKPVVVYVPMNKDGTCPPGDEPASGGYCRHKIQSTENTPPAAPPTNTPPAQPQQPTPSQPECELGFHWDTSQQECVPNGPK